MVYPGESLTVRNLDLSAGTHVYVAGRTATGGGFERAHELQDARRITAATAHPYQGREFDEDSRKSVGAELETHAAEADFSQAFGTPAGTDPYQHLLGARLGWGGLPPSDAQYFQASATSSGADVWTFDVPPLDYEHNGYFSVIKYDGMGWLDADRPGLSDRELVRNDDGTISVWFGDDRIADKPNVIRATEGQTFYYGMRVYRPHDAEETRQFIEAVRSMPLRPVD